MDRTERVGRRLRLRDLQLFDSVVRWGSISKAATHLNLTQSAASKAIVQLERSLGVRLLDRSTRGVAATPYGRVLIKRGVAIFDELRQGMKEIEFLADPTVGELRVGSEEAISAGLLPAIIEQLWRQYPRIVCQMVPTPGSVALQFHALRERRVDLVVVRLPESGVEDDLNADVLFYERLYVVAGKRSKWHRRRRIELAELVNEAWILTPPDLMPYPLVKQAFRAKGLEVPPASLLSTSIHLQNALQPTGRFLTVMGTPVLHFGAMRAHIKALPVDFPAPPRTVAVVTLKNRTLSPAANLFVEAARAVTKRLAKAKPR